MRKFKLKYEHSFVALSILLIPVLTIIFGTMAPPSEFTFSKIGNHFDARLEFIIWGTVTALLFTFYILHLFKLGAFFNKRARWMVIRSGIFLILTVLIPAVDELWPFLNKLHTICGGIFALTLIISVYYLIRYLRIFNKSLYSLSFFLLMTVVGGSLVLRLIFGNSGIYELFFFISMSIVLFILEILIKKNRQKLQCRIDNLKKNIKQKNGKHNKEISIQRRS